MKKSSKALTLCLVLILAFLLTGCGAVIDNQLDLKSDYSGTRSVIFRVPNDIVSRYCRGQTDVISDFLKRHMPDGLSLNVVKAEEYANFIMTYSFKDMKEYQEKTNEMFSAWDSKTAYLYPEIKTVHSMFGDVIRFSEGDNLEAFSKWAIDAMYEEKKIGTGETFYETGTYVITLDGAPMDTEHIFKRYYGKANKDLLLAKDATVVTYTDFSGDYERVITIRFDKEQLKNIEKEEVLKLYKDKFTDVTMTENDTLVSYQAVIQKDASKFSSHTQQGQSQPEENNDIAALSNGSYFQTTSSDMAFGDANWIYETGQVYDLLGGTYCENGVTFIYDVPQNYATYLSQRDLSDSDQVGKYGNEIIIENDEYKIFLQAQPKKQLISSVDITDEVSVFGTVDRTYRILVDPALFEETSREELKAAYKKMGFSDRKVTNQDNHELITLKANAKNLGSGLGLFESYHKGNTLTLLNEFDLKVLLSGLTPMQGITYHMVLPGGASLVSFQNGDNVYLDDNKNVTFENNQLSCTLEGKQLAYSVNAQVELQIWTYFIAAGIVLVLVAIAAVILYKRKKKKSLTITDHTQEVTNAKNDTFTNAEIDANPDIEPEENADIDATENQDSDIGTNEDKDS